VQPHEDQALRAIDDARGGITTSTAWLSVARESLSKLSSYVSKEGKSYYETLQQAIAKAAEAQKVVDTGLIEAKHEIQDLGDENAKLKVENDKFFSRKQRRIFFWVVTIWALCGVASIFLGLNPLSGLFSVSREIVRFVPFMNPFAWIRDMLQKRSAKRVVGR
jgi:hypothetical protein